MTPESQAIGLAAGLVLPPADLDDGLGKSTVLPVSRWNSDRPVRGDDGLLNESEAPDETALAASAVSSASDFLLSLTVRLVGRSKLILDFFSRTCWTFVATVILFRMSCTYQAKPEVRRLAQMGIGVVKGVELGYLLHDVVDLLLDLEGERNVVGVL